jgi:hypothetical protein
MGAWIADVGEWMKSNEYQTASSTDKVTTMLGTWEYRFTCSLAQTIGAKQVRHGAKPWVQGGDLLRQIKERDELRTRCEKFQQRHNRSTEEHPEWRSLAAQALHAQREVRKEIHRRKKRQREETFQSIEREWRHQSYSIDGCSRCALMVAVWHRASVHRCCATRERTYWSTM